MKRVLYLLVAATALAGFGVTTFSAMPMKLLWNATASAPIGLYAVGPVDKLEVGDLVVVRPDEALEDFMVERGYIGRGVPLLKHIAALSGQQVCRIGRDIMVDGRFAAAALDRDSRGRELPVWQGCQQIAPNAVFLLNPAARDSLDSRYFGPLSVTDVLGKTQPLYTDPTGTGRFIWRATAP
ncbi:S26 family signal peptidase [Asticcacaulis sp. AND118]|uniref:S26 family signal peptidase n=1 Tax=Asticcacaulis sp. AND118 TaxID=2840468 RepID=UPI001CFF793C|nr:S26 family signal peptidase [Asticcacaulis sp. AND118]UDF04731.1 S26 family signal peptidase [Asticcacaulis sp. AND118]